MRAPALREQTQCIVKGLSSTDNSVGKHTSDYSWLHACIITHLRVHTKTRTRTHTLMYAHTHTFDIQTHQPGADPWLWEV